MRTMLTYHCKLCDKRFYHKRNGKKGRVYCSRACLAKDLIAGRDSHMHWIRIDEKKPEAGQEIIVYKRFDEIMSFYAVVRYEGKLNQNLSHWMPLPKPPKELRRKK